MVWKSSEQLGVGVAKNRHGRIYVVANYSPAGNFVGDYVENVLPLVEPVQDAEARAVTPEVVVQDAGEFDQFAVDGLKAHNDYRRKHGVAELRLNKKVR